jgi:hypothetical protein
VLVAASPKTVAVLATSRTSAGGTPAGSLPSAASSPNLLHQQSGHSQVCSRHSARREGPRL